MRRRVPDIQQDRAADRVAPDAGPCDEILDDVIESQRGDPRRLGAVSGRTGLPDEARADRWPSCLALRLPLPPRRPPLRSPDARTSTTARGYKGHASPTPYLGGAAVLGGFLVAAALLAATSARLSPIVACSCALWALGTLDDRRGLAAWPRVAAECLAAIVLWSTGLGWNLLPGDGAISRSRWSGLSVWSTRST